MCKIYVLRVHLCNKCLQISQLVIDKTRMSMQVRAPGQDITVLYPEVIRRISENRHRREASSEQSMARWKEPVTKSIQTERVNSLRTTPTQTRGPGCNCCRHLFQLHVVI